MKKFVWLALSVPLLLTACSNSQDSNEPSTKDGATGESTSTQSLGSATNSSSEPRSVNSNSDTSPIKLKFATYILSDEMQTAVKNYETLHPNVDIELQTTLPSGKDVDEVMALQEKYITMLNTEVLAGKGPDLMELDVLPQESYARKKHLVNLDELIKASPSFQSDNYFMNVLGNAKLDGGLYGMPLYFSLAA